ncbi:hypothetical protein QFC21_006816 [Naganishia friedmannii]|uniref:Uncharacterized protein n=1 Tax=Naganishia friedmannii TaxID=89922 RepID=A0ACC2UZR4_9TREE|nr:hypothetical protein QFC21_006816 [Naganishia friedmannii]
MGGPNLEILRFAMYLAVPTASILYFGDPTWYDRYVVPKPPKTQAEIQEQLAKFKADRLEKKKAQGLTPQEGNSVQSGHDTVAATTQSIRSQLPDTPFDSRPSQGTPAGRLV